MKKALIVSNSSGLITDFLENDISILKEHGYEIECACNTNYPGKDTNNFMSMYDVKIHNVEFPIRNLNIKSIIKSIKDVKYILKNEDYDLIHCHSTIAAAIGRYCSIKYRKKGTKIVYTCHGYPFFSGNNGIKSKIFYIVEKYLSKYTDAIINICEEDYQNSLKFKCKKVYKINGVGVDTTNIINTKINKKRKKEELNIPCDKKIILSIGEINSNKNHQVIINALSKIGSNDYVYIICGREVTEKGKIEELELLAKKLNVNVKFLGFRKDIPEICHIADIGAIPSYKEGLGLAGIEMLAAGIPVVGSNRQGIKDYVINGVTGFLANPDNSESFAKAIISCSNLANSSECKNNCIKKAKEFSAEKSRKIIEKAYKDICLY